MKEYLIDIWIVIGIIVLINSIIFLTKSESRFWKIPILVWGLFLVIISIAVPVQNRQINNLDKEYWESTEGKSYGDREIWKDLKNSRKLTVKIRLTLIHFLGFQTIATFLFQIIGYRKTNKKKTYQWTSTVFGLLSLTYLIFQFMVEIVPTEPFF
tara:strand:+ start:61 stop:525 length:465 start_codon:yes stop_codon:yes gene_type:complete